MVQCQLIQNPTELINTPGCDLARDNTVGNTHSDLAECCLLMDS
jgi:hypothetical protein